MVQLPVLSICSIGSTFVIFCNVWMLVVTLAPNKSYICCSAIWLVVCSISFILNVTVPSVTYVDPAVQREDTVSSRWDRCWLGFVLNLVVCRETPCFASGIDTNCILAGGIRNYDTNGEIFRCLFIYLLCKAGRTQIQVIRSLPVRYEWRLWFLIYELIHTHPARFRPFPQSSSVSWSKKGSSRRFWNGWLVL